MEDSWKQRVNPFFGFSGGERSASGDASVQDVMRFSIRLRFADFFPESSR